MKWFTGAPNEHGWYFFSFMKENWDTANPVEVRSIERPGHQPVYEVKLQGVWQNVKHNNLPKEAIWYGPIVLPKPSERLII